MNLLEILKDLYNEFQTTGQIACESVGVEKYSRKIQVEKLAHSAGSGTSGSGISGSGDSSSMTGSAPVVGILKKVRPTIHFFK